MLEMSASIDGAAVASFNSALRDYSKALGAQSSTAPRRVAIQICKSLRAGTRKAPKFARSSEYTVIKSKTPPKHVTSSKGVDLRRFHVSRPIRKSEYDVFERDRRDVRKRHLRLDRAGLAKQSWGWVMNNIFNGAAPDTPWKRKRTDRRNPKEATKDSYSRVENSLLASRGVARIANRIDYIGAALKQGVTVESCVQKAVNWTLKQIQRLGLKKRR